MNLTPRSICGQILRLAKDRISLESSPFRTLVNRDYPTKQNDELLDWLRLLVARLQIQIWKLESLVPSGLMSNWFMISPPKVEAQISFAVQHEPWMRFSCPPSRSYHALYESVKRDSVKRHLKSKPAQSLPDIFSCDVPLPRVDPQKFAEV